MQIKKKKSQAKTEPFMNPINFEENESLFPKCAIIIVELAQFPSLKRTQSGVCAQLSQVLYSKYNQSVIMIFRL